MAPDTCSCSRSPQPELAGPRYFLAQFCYLQFLDLLTTLAFLCNGVAEANPVVRLAMAAAGSRLLGLIAVKMLAVAGAWYCAVCGRWRLLVRVNVFFAALIVWNVLAMIGR
jgi:hypothetical protein